MKKQRYIIIFASLAGIVLCVILAKIYPSRSPTYYHLVVDTTVVADRPAVYHFYIHPE